MRTLRHKYASAVVQKTLTRMQLATAALETLSFEPALVGVPGWVQKEVPASAASAASRPRGDILTTDRAGKTIVGDFTVTAANVLACPAAAHTAGAAAAKAYLDKVTKYKGGWTFPEGGFMPLVMEAGGWMHPDMRSYLRMNVAIQIRKGDTGDWTAKQKADYSLTINTMLTSISVTLARSAAHTVLRLANAIREGGAGAGV